MQLPEAPSSSAEKYYNKAKIPCQHSAAKRESTWLGLLSDWQGSLGLGKKKRKENKILNRNCVTIKKDTRKNVDQVLKHNKYLVISSYLRYAINFLPVSIS